MSLTTSERLKFRAWHLNLLEMEYDVQVLDRFAEILARPETFAVMQATGLNDKNGKEIYELDRLQDSSGEIWIVYWYDYHACFGWYNEKQPHIKAEIIDNLNTRVIGNVYENPELLKP